MHSIPGKVLLTALLVLPACGFIGFETDSDAGGDAALVPPEAGPEMDAGEEDAGLDARVELDAEVDAELDAEVDAEVDAAIATPVSDYCMAIPALPNEPVIDGEVDARLSLVPIVPLGWAGAASGNPGHTTAEFAAAFRPNGLYVFVHVTDPNRLPPVAGGNSWEGDGVEVYVDDDGVYAASPAYDNPGSVQIITHAPNDDVNPVSTGTRFRDAISLGAWTSPSFAAFPTADGYVLEALVTADGIDRASWTLSSGGHVGFNISINVSGLDAEVGTDAGLQGNRLGQYFLNLGGDACGGRPYCSSASFCNPLLVD